MKKIFLTILIIIFCIGLVCSGCFLFKKYFKVDTKKKLTFWTIDLKSVYEKPILRIIEEFEQNHPNYKVVWVDIPAQEAEKRTLASALSSNPPDLVNLNPDFSILLAQRNALYLFEEDETEQFHPALVNKLRYDGRVYSLPFYATSAVTVYNKDVLSKCGINADTIKTYDDLFEASKNMTCQIPIFISNINENNTFAKILNKYNVSEFKTDSEKENAEAIYDMFNQMYKTNKLPKDTLAINHREVVERYMAQKSAIIVAGSNFVNMIKQNAPDVYSKSELKEQLTGSNGNYDISLMNLVIPKKSENIEEALDLALLLTNKENQLELSKLTNVIPANKYALEDEYFKTPSSDLYEHARYLSARQLDKLNEIDFGNKNKKVINEEINSTLEEILLNPKSDENYIKLKVEKLSEAIKKLQKAI